MLYDAITGEPLARIDGNEITARRASAAPALAALSLARPEARRLLVVGSGRVAAHIPEAFRQVLLIDEAPRLGSQGMPSPGSGGFPQNWRH